MKYAMLCGAMALALFMAANVEAGGPGQKYFGGYYGGNYSGHYRGGHQYGYGGCCPPGWDVSPYANPYAQWYGAGAGHGNGGAFGVPVLPSPAYTPGPPTAAVTYPYYTVRGPRDFLLDNPPSLGP